MQKMKVILSRLLGIGPIEYDIVFKNITSNGKFLINGANSFIFVNQGTSIVTIENSFTLGVDRSLSFPGELFEDFDGGFNIAFSTGTGNLVAIIKQYR
jgi:hypothetical protein